MKMPRHYWRYISMRCRQADRETASLLWFLGRFAPVSPGLRLENVLKFRARSVVLKDTAHGTHRHGDPGVHSAISGGSDARRKFSRPYPANRLWVLGIQDAVERHGTGAVLAACGRPQDGP